MKILYLLRSVEHFFAHETVVKKLCSDGHDVELLFDAGWSQNHADHSAKNCVEATPNLRMGYSIRRYDHWRRFIFMARELLSYSNYLSMKNQSKYYIKRWERYQPLWIQILSLYLKPFRLFLGSRLIKLLLRTFERIVPPDSSITYWLQMNRPDIMVVSSINLRFSEDIEYVKAAKALGIPVVYIVLSWDNLTTKGVIHIVPDLTLAWNQNQVDLLTSIHCIPKDKIIIIGSPRFDMWFTDIPKMNREDFCKKVGLDANKPFMLYLGSSKNIASDETWLVRELAQCLRKHSNPNIREMNILVRPHPANAKVYEKLEEEKVCVWPKKGTPPDSKDSLQDFYNSLKYCVATIAINNSAMIDAVINDKPCISTVTKLYQATQIQTIHYRDLFDAGIFEIATNGEEFNIIIERLWRGEDLKKENRHKFVKDFIRPCGLRQAGEIAAQAIEEYKI